MSLVSKRILSGLRTVFVENGHFSFSSDELLIKFLNVLALSFLEALR